MTARNKNAVVAIVAMFSVGTPALAADCAKDYKDFWTNIDRAAFDRLSPAQMIDLNRTALRVYDGCTAGDEQFTAKNFFEQLDASRYDKAADIFNSGAFAPPGARK